MEESTQDLDDCISDESSFYGEDDVKGEFELAVRRPLKRSYEPPFPPAMIKKAKVAQDIPPELVANGKDDGLQKVNFFESRKGDGAWRQDETIDAFLRRLQVSDPATSTQDGWIWVGTPKISRSHLRHIQDTAHVESFTAQGSTLLQKYEAVVSQIQKDNADKAESTVSRKISPYRKRLAENILALGVSSKTTSGKWMLFPGSDDLPHYWRQIAIATAEGKLGTMSKVATHQPGRSQTLICVYTYDFTDVYNVRHVLDRLIDLGLVALDARPIYYKCDAYTHLGIEGSNKWGLKASLFSSREVLANDTKALGSLAKSK